MDDSKVLRHISELTEEERQLEEGQVGEALAAHQLERLRAIEVELDRCWDLLRQRRARRSAGQDPDQATERPASVVERYQQ
jgi:hypothetical protein